MNIMRLAVLGAIGDAYTTVVALEHHGMEEANPAAAWLMGHVGVLPWALISIGLFITIIWILKELGEADRSARWAFLLPAWVMVIIKLLVVASNVSLLL